MGKILKSVAVPVLILLLLLPAIWSCNDLGCLDNRSSIPLARLYASGGTIPKEITVDSLTVYGVGQRNDSLLMDSAMSVAQISFPFRDNLDSSQFVIQYNYSWNRHFLRNDTITFFYEPYVFFASLECGSMFYYTLDSIRYTRNTLDSIRVLTPEITNRNVTNFQIFYTPSSIR